jgi:hypothetical protein
LHPNPACLFYVPSISSSKTPSFFFLVRSLSTSFSFCFLLNIFSFCLLHVLSVSRYSFYQFIFFIIVLVKSPSRPVSISLLLILIMYLLIRSHFRSISFLFCHFLILPRSCHSRSVSFSLFRFLILSLFRSVPFLFCLFLVLSLCCSVSFLFCLFLVLSLSCSVSFVFCLFLVLSPKLLKNIPLWIWLLLWFYNFSNKDFKCGLIVSSNLENMKKKPFQSLPAAYTKYFPPDLKGRSTFFYVSHFISC